MGQLDVTLDISPADDTIVFSATGAGERDLFLLHLDDLHVTRIAETPEYEVWPHFSADGKSVVYAAGVPGDRADHIFVRPVDGGPAQQLTNVDANDFSPRFSPDGTMMVFARNNSYSWGGLAANWSGSVICVMQSDGTNERQLTADEEGGYNPVFSSDGKSIIFSTTDRRMSISVEGSAPPKRLPGQPGAELSPDAKLLAYCKGKYSPDVKIYLSNADGTSERLLTPHLGGCFRPTFNHRSDRLFFLRQEWPNGPMGVPKFNLWEATTDGTTVHMLADYQLFDSPLGWKSPSSP